MNNQINEVSSFFHRDLYSHLLNTKESIAMYDFIHNRGVVEHMIRRLGEFLTDLAYADDRNEFNHDILQDNFPSKFLPLKYEY